MFPKLFIFTCPEPASYQRAFLTEPHRRPLYPLCMLIVLQNFPRYLCHTFTHHTSANWPSWKEGVWRVWAQNFLLTETALNSISAVMFLGEGDGEWEKSACRPAWWHAIHRCTNSRGTQAADIHVSSCFIDILFSGMLRSGRSIWPYLHHPLLWNLITDIWWQSHHSLAVNIHWGSLRA